MMISESGLIFLSLRMKREGLACVAFGVVGIADDEGELGDDAEFLCSLGDGDGLIGGDALLHLFEGPIGAGLCAEEDHGAAGALERGEGFVGVAGHDVDARLAPPAEIEMFDAARKFERVIFAKEEVHVVELNGVGTVFCDKVGEDCGGALGRFHRSLLP